MHSLTAESATELFTRTCQTIQTKGAPVAPRGLSTRELLGAHLRLTRPRCRFVDAAPVRALNPAFAAAEAVWILSGSDDPWIFTFNERLRRFADHGRLRGAYGPRLRNWRGRDQLDSIRHVLDGDASSRQAVIQIFDPARDFSGYRDVPCTLGYRFYIRSGTLVMVTSMRSQDAWLGLPYDVFTTTVLHELLAGWLEVDLGDYHHVIDSLHLYDQHIEQARSLGHQAGGAESPCLQVPWEDFDALLAQVIAGERVGHPGWDDFATVLGSYRLWKDGEYDKARAMLPASSGQPLSSALARWYELLEATPERIAAAPVAPAGAGRLV